MKRIRLPALFVIAALSAPTITQAFEATSDEVNAFLGADLNKDLVLDRSEFKTFILLMAQAGQSTSKTVRAFNAYGYAFKITDKNRDGVITPQELRSADDEFRASN